MNEKKTKRQKTRKIKGFFADFKEFISKGNILELAIAVIIGGAFGKIVSSLVNDIVMPLITLLVGGTAVSDWKWIIKAAEFDASGVEIVAENALRYGIFIQSILDFLIIALFIFLALRVYMSIKKRWDALKEQETQTEEAAAEPSPAPEKAPEAETLQPATIDTTPLEAILTEIRDLLKYNKE